MRFEAGGSELSRKACDERGDPENGGLDEIRSWVHTHHLRKLSTKRRLGSQGPFLRTPGFCCMA